MLSVRRILGAVFVAVLLAAQQAALEHPLWHVAAAPEQSPLCAQHDTLGAVLGAIDCADATTTDEAPAAQSVAFIAAPAPSLASIVPFSRGPPALL